MTAAQKRKLIKAIQSGCQVDTRYFGWDSKKQDNTPECGMCVVGSMVVMTTKPDSPLREILKKEVTMFINHLALIPVSEHLQREFGLSERELLNLQRKNDATSGCDSRTELRRSRLLDFVDEIWIEKGGADECSPV